MRLLLIIQSIDSLYFQVIKRRHAAFIKGGVNISSIVSKALVSKTAQLKANSFGFVIDSMKLCLAQGGHCSIWQDDHMAEHLNFIQ